MLRGKSFPPGISLTCITPGHSMLVLHPTAPPGHSGGQADPCSQHPGGREGTEPPGRLVSCVPRLGPGSRVPFQPLRDAPAPSSGGLPDGWGWPEGSPCTGPCRGPRHPLGECQDPGEPGTGGTPPPPEERGRARRRRGLGAPPACYRGQTRPPPGLPATPRGFTHQHTRLGTPETPNGSGRAHPEPAHPQSSGPHSPGHPRSDRSPTACAAVDMALLLVISDGKEQMASRGEAGGWVASPVPHSTQPGQR